VAQRGEVAASCSADRRPDLGQGQGEQEQRGELGGEGLGRGDADLGAGAGHEAQRGFAHDGGFGHVADGQRAAHAQRLGVLERGQGVGGFAGLRDGDDQGSGSGTDSR
jgi:hypothetical protein